MNINVYSLFFCFIKQISSISYQMISTVELFFAFLFLHFLQVASYSTCFDLSVQFFDGPWLIIRD